MSKYICTICNYADDCSTIPAKCPYCGVPSTNLRMLTEKEASELLTKNNPEKSLVGTMTDSIALSGYNPKGVNKQNMFA